MYVSTAHLGENRLGANRLVSAHVENSFPGQIVSVISYEVVIFSEAVYDALGYQLADTNVVR